MLPAGSLPLPAAAEVRIFLLDLPALQAALPPLAGLLTPAERARADRFRFPVDRQRLVLGRGVVRLLLGAACGCAPARVRLTSNAYDKPLLAAGQGPPLTFNVSHGGERVLVAVALNRPVGVDVEPLNLPPEYVAISRQQFAADEREALLSAPPQAHAATFFRIWTRKEALIKAHGAGLSLPLDAFSVSVRPEEPPALLRTAWDPADAAAWQLVDIDAGENHAAALAARGQDWRPVPTWATTANLLAALHVATRDTDRETDDL
jgi:4'-phosphopantetheinyl transferase